MGAKPGTLENDSINQGGAFAVPGGIVYGRDGQVMREMVATVALNGGDAVVLDPLNGLYNVNKAATADQTKVYGIVTGAQIGTQAAGVAAAVWVVVEGVALAQSGASTINQGDVVSTSSTFAGAVYTSAGAQVVAFSAALVPAAVVAAATPNVAEQNLTVPGVLATDIFVGVDRTALSGTTTSIVGGTVTASAVRVAFLGTSASFTPASGTYNFTVRRAAAFANAALGVALVSASASGTTIPVFVRY